MQVTLIWPRCPFSPVGLQGTSACPGFVSEPVPERRLPWFSPVTMPAGESCRHLRTQDSSRGFVPACQHPGGLPAGAEAAARSLIPARRRRPGA